MRLKHYLTETNTSNATNMELAIVQAWNREKPRFPDLDPIAQNIVKMFKGWGFDQNREKATHLGSSVHFKVTKDWSKYGAINPTPKTDFIIGRARISLKKEGGSQLMSGGKEETLATFHAAIKQLHMEGSPIVDKIDEYVNNFIRITSPYNTTQTKKSNTEAGYKLIETEYIHKSFTGFLTKYFSDNPEFKKAIIHEAMSGQVKFGDKSRARAKFILVYDAKNGVKNKWHKIDDPSFITSKAQSTKIGIRWKSIRKHGKYNIYSTLRLVNNEAKKYISEYDILNENVINNIVDRVKKFFTKIWVKIKEWLSESMENVLSFLGLEPVLDPVLITF